MPIPRMFQRRQPVPIIMLTALTFIQGKLTVVFLRLCTVGVYNVLLQQCTYMNYVSGEGHIAIKIYCTWQTQYGALYVNQWWSCGPWTVLVHSLLLRNTAAQLLHCCLCSVRPFSCRCILLNMLNIVFSCTRYFTSAVLWTQLDYLSLKRGSYWHVHVGLPDILVPARTMQETSQI
jgi:hypothetical protein